MASARCAFVGGLKDESRMYNAFVVCDVAFRILNDEEEAMKDWR